MPLPELQRLPRDWSKVPWRAGRELLAPAARLVTKSVLADPPGRARLTFHAVERLGDNEGWGGERLVFLGYDGRWRSLDMADLGLSDSVWPGVDTYGAGALSEDGRTWAGRTKAGVVLLDPGSGRAHHVELPGPFSQVGYLTWVPGRETLAAVAGHATGGGLRAFDIDRSGRVTRARYPASDTRFDVQGTPVSIVWTHGRLRVTRYESSGPVVATWPSPGRLRGRTQYGTFGSTSVLLVQWPDDLTGPSTLWVLDKVTGEPTARLRSSGQAAAWPVRWDRESVVLLIDNQALVAWNPTSGSFERVLRLAEPPTCAWRMGCRNRRSSRHLTYRRVHRSAR